MATKITANELLNYRIPTAQDLDNAAIVKYLKQIVSDKAIYGLGRLYNYPACGYDYAMEYKFNHKLVDAIAKYVEANGANEEISKSLEEVYKLYTDKKCISVFPIVKAYAKAKNQELPNIYVNQPLSEDLVEYIIKRNNLIDNSMDSLGTLLLSISKDLWDDITWMPRELYNSLFTTYIAYLHEIVQEYVKYSPIGAVKTITVPALMKCVYLYVGFAGNQELFDLRSTLANIIYDEEVITYYKNFINDANYILLLENFKNANSVKEFKTNLINAYPNLTEKDNIPTIEGNLIPALMIFMVNNKSLFRKGTTAYDYLHEGLEKVKFILTDSISDKRYNYLPAGAYRDLIDFARNYYERF